MAEVAREIGRIDAAELSRDTSGARAYAAFLTETGDRVPGAMLPHVSLLMALMDGEVNCHHNSQMLIGLIQAYCMRNAVLSILGSIVRLHLTTNRDENSASDRDQVCVCAL